MALVTARGSNTDRPSTNLSTPPEKSALVVQNFPAEILILRAERTPLTPTSLRRCTGRHRSPFMRSMQIRVRSWSRSPSEMRDDLSKDDTLRIATVENLQRQNLA